MRASAVLSDCGRYRYALERAWEPAPGAARRSALFVLLNPSTADASRDDPTLRRCLAFARAAGCSRLLVCNLFALRATDPAALRTAADPIGPDADAWLARSAAQAELIVAGWGAHAAHHPERAARVHALLAARGPLHCLGVTRGGHPRHPLYVAGVTALVPLVGP